MKRTVSIVISMMCVASALLFNSCQSDPIVGTWTVDSKRVVQYVDGVVVSDESESDLNSKYSNLQQFEFYSDGSYTDYPAVGVPLNGKWSLMDDGYYSLDAELSDYFSQKEGYTEFAPATHIARLIDNQTLEMQQMIHILITTDEGETKLEFEITSLFERIK